MSKGSVVDLVVAILQGVFILALAGLWVSFIIDPEYTVNVYKAMWSVVDWFSDV